MNKEQIITPFLHWVGGKGQSIKEIVADFPKHDRYFEPFIGGGALLLATRPKIGIINDLNSELINLWQVVRDKPKELINYLEDYRAKHSIEYYYQCRSLLNELKVEKLKETTRIQRAGLFLYLNKAGFNGLCRENSKGFINVPFGHKKKITLFNKANIMSVSEYLRTNNIKIFNFDYKSIAEEATAEDFVYLDPPYDETYNGYNGGSFSQPELKDFCDLLSKKGVKWLQTNKNTETIRELYQGYKQKPITVNAVLNSNGKKRKDCRQDLIITNYAI